MALSCDYFNAARCRSCPDLGKLHGDYTTEKMDSFRALVKSELAGDPLILPLKQPNRAFGTRTKAKLSVSGTLENPILGLLDGDLRGIELLNCPLHDSRINQLLNKLPKYIQDYKLTPYDITRRSGELKGVQVKAGTQAISLRFILRSTEALPRIKKAIASIQETEPLCEVIGANIQPIPHAIPSGAEEILLTENQYIVEDHGPFKLYYPTEAFTQVTFETSNLLYRYVSDKIANLSPAGILDLYCGVGGFSFACAPHADAILGLELSAGAIKAARYGAIENGMNHLSFEVVDLEKQSNLNFNFDTIIVNPPKRGLSKPIREFIEQSEPKYLFYSSCNPETLVRDLMELPNYQIVEFAPFDMFPLTPHLEVVAQCQRIAGN